jgi:hypothetical protein
MCGRPAGRMLAAMKAKPISISLELRLDEDSFAGRATTPTGQERTFTGWLGLMGAIDALLDEQGTEDDR